MKKIMKVPTDTKTKKGRRNLIQRWRKTEKKGGERETKQKDEDRKKRKREREKEKGRKRREKGTPGSWAPGWDWGARPESGIATLRVKWRAVVLKGAHAVR